MYIGKKLKEIRISKDLNQSDIAYNLGVSQSYYSSVELSKKPATKKMLKKINEIWGLKSDFFKPELQNKLGVESGGLPGGLKKEQVKTDVEDRKKDLKTFTNQQKLLRELEASNPDIYKLYSFIFPQSDLENFLLALTYAMHKPLHNPSVTQEKYLVDGKFDYARYKADFVQHYSRLMFIKPAFEKLLNAAKELYQVVEEQDMEGVLKEFLPEYEQHISEMTGEASLL